MQDSKFLRDQARRCRALMRSTVEPDVIEQLHVWAVELAEEADEVGRCADDQEIDFLL